jgi:hypothetical protein
LRPVAAARCTATANSASSGAAAASPSISRSAPATASIVETRPGDGDSRSRAAGIGASGSRRIGRPRSCASLRNIRRACDHVASRKTSWRGGGTGVVSVGAPSGNTSHAPSSGGSTATPPLPP